MRARSHTTLLITFAAVALVACTAPDGGGAAVDVEAEAQAIRDLSAGWMEAANAKDWETVGGIFATDAETIFDGEHYMGRAAIMANTEAEWAETPDGVVSWATTGVEVAASGDLAVERGNWTFDPDGAGEAEAEHGEYVTVYRKIDGEWQVVVDAGTTLGDDDDDADDDDDDADDDDDDDDGDGDDG